MLPKFAFGIQHRPVPKQALGALRTDLRRALGIDKKVNAWEILCSCVFPGHLIDPLLKAFSVHAMSVCYALREGTHSLVEAWRGLWDMPQRRIPRGPVGTLKSYFRTFGISGGDSGLEWSKPGLKGISVLETDTRAIAHFVREAGRIMFMEKMEQCRSHLQGCRHIDRDRTSMHTKKEGHVHRRFLIPIISDAVWTMSRRHKCGLVETPNCPWCPDTPEDLDHLWYRCPKWHNYRAPILRHMGALMASPACVRTCFVATVNMPEPLKKAWSCIQISAATIFKERHDAQPAQIRRTQNKHGGGGEGFRTGLPPPCPQQGTPLSWQYTENLQSGRITWPSTRQAWREMCCWARHLRVIEGEHRVSVLELYLSFLEEAGGQRFITDIPNDDNGGRISTQLTAFVHGLKAFLHIAQAPPILESHTDRNRPNLLAHYGFPRLCNSSVGLWYPHQREVRDKLSQAMSEISVSTQEMHASQIWRRWAPGKEGSQMTHLHMTWAKPLWQYPRKRLVGKRQQPLWSIVAARVSCNWSELLSLDSSIVGGVRWLDDFGYCDPGDLSTIKAQLRWKVKRIQQLQVHSGSGEAREGHLVPLWEQQQRPHCLLCGGVGYACKPFAFLRQVCPSRHAVDAAARRDSLNLHLATALARANDHLDAIDAIARCLSQA